MITIMITMQKYEILLYHANILVLFLRFFLEWICKVLDISEICDSFGVAFIFARGLIIG